MCNSLGQIHGALLISPDGLSVDQLSQELRLSSTSIKSHLKTLLEWSLISQPHCDQNKVKIYQAEKNVWKVFQLVVKHRKKKELEPLLELLRDIQDTEGQNQESKEIRKISQDWLHFSSKADRALDKICALNQSLVARTLFH